MMLRLSLLVILLSATLQAAEYQPYPEARITTEQWQEYFDTVWLEFAETMQELTEVNLILFRDETTSTDFAFTTGDNPAHPAWVARRVLEQDGVFSMDQIGYFAGDEGAFADLFDAYADISDELRQEFESE